MDRSAEIIEGSLRPLGASVSPGVGDGGAKL